MRGDPAGIVSRSGSMVAAVDHRAPFPGPCGGRRGFLTDRVVAEDHPVTLAGWVEDQVGHQGYPPGLVPGAQAGAVVAVEVLVTKRLLPPWVGVQPVAAAVDGSPAVGSGEPDGDEPVGEVPGDRPAGSAGGRSGWGIRW